MKKIMIVLAIAAMTPAVFAQTFSTLNVETRGQGSFRQTGFGDDRIQSVAANLERNGRATLTFKGTNSRKASGNWKLENGGLVRLIIDKVDNHDRLRGGGTLRVENGQVISVDISGDRDNWNYRANFQRGNNNDDWNRGNGNGNGNGNGRGNGNNGNGNSNGDWRNGDWRDSDWTNGRWWGQDGNFREDRFRRGSRGTVNGDGELKMQGRFYDVSSINYDLNQDGRFTMNVRGRYNTTLKGMWRQERNNANQIYLDFSEGFNSRDLRGRGELHLGRNGQADAFNMTGNYGRESVSIQFGPEYFNDYDRWSRTYQTSFDATGDGDLRVGRDRYDINKVTVRLERNGTFRISAQRGKNSDAISGKWRRDRDTSTLILDVDDGFGDGDTRGKGTIKFDNRNQFQSLEISGRTGRGDYRLNFRDR